MVFRDIQQARPAAVDVLLEPQRAVVTAVNQDDCSLVLNKPVRVEVASPVFVGAQPRQVVHAEEEVVWLERVQEERRRMWVPLFARINCVGTCLAFSRLSSPSGLPAGTVTVTLPKTCGHPQRL